MVNSYKHLEMQERAVIETQLAFGMRPDYFERFRAQSIQKNLVRRLEKLGNTVILQPPPASA